MPFSHLILCRSLLLPSIFPNIRVFSSESVLQFFISGGQSIGVSASALILPVNIQDWFPLGWTGWISLQSKGLSRVFSNTTVQKHQFFSAQLSLWSKSHIHIWLLKKTIALTGWTFVGKVMSLLFNMLSKFVIAFLPRSKCLLISWLQSPSAVILEPKKISLSLFPLSHVDADLIIDEQQGTRGFHGSCHCSKAAVRGWAVQVASARKLRVYEAHTNEKTRSYLFRACWSEKSQPPSLAFGRFAKSGSGVGKVYSVRWENFRHVLTVGTEAVGTGNLEAGN